MYWKMLENFHFYLKATRLGKHINELRRKASDKGLASRAKSLVKKWRELLVPDNNSGTTTPISSGPQVRDQARTVAAGAVQKLTNGHYSTSQPSSRLTSPAVSSSSRLSPGLRPPPSSSMPSSASSSPGLSRPTTPNHDKSRPVSPVSKTNVANKRLRKEEEIIDEPAAKKAKVRLEFI